VIKKAGKIVSADFGIRSDQAEAQLSLPAMQPLAGPEHFLGEGVDAVHTQASPVRGQLSFGLLKEFEVVQFRVYAALL